MNSKYTDCDRGYPTLSSASYQQDAFIELETHKNNRNVIDFISEVTPSVYSTHGPIGNRGENASETEQGIIMLADATSKKVFRAPYQISEFPLSQN